MRAVLLIIFLAICTVPCEAGKVFFLNYRWNVVGPIVKLKGAWVHVKDEKGIDTYRFFAHTKRLEDFRVGDRVRVYFYKNDNRLISIQKMTPLACQEGQNRGIISGCQK